MRAIAIIGVLASIVLMLSSCSGCSDNNKVKLYDGPLPTLVEPEEDDVDSPITEIDDVIEDEPEDVEIATHMEQCPICVGLRVCLGCSGAGTLYRFGEWQDCSACGGTGVCPACNGTGLVEVVGY